MSSSNYEAVKRYRARHPEKYRAQVKKRNAKKRALISAWVKADRAAHPEKWRAYYRAYHAGHKDAARVSRKKYKKTHPHIQLAAYAKRRANKRAALCSCCTSRQFSDFYAAAALLGHHVDHIVPLADGGAHCIKNLQMLSAEDHAIKTAAENSRRLRRL
jgi:5-methylcytosine-specific restriction endonuclease McrA